MLSSSLPAFQALSWVTRIDGVYCPHSARATHTKFYLIRFRTSFFLIGFYTLSLVCFVLILRFGILQAVNPPSTTLRGLFVLASTVAGVAGGAVSIFFWKATRYFIGAWGGLALAWWIQCFRAGGLIGPLGFRWIFYIGACSVPARLERPMRACPCLPSAHACGTGVAVVGFVLCTIPKLHYYVLLTSTAFVGATAFMLGVDCYTTAGLKEVCALIL